MRGPFIISVIGAALAAALLAWLALGTDLLEFGDPAERRAGQPISPEAEREALLADIQTFGYDESIVVDQTDGATLTVRDAGDSAEMAFPDGRELSLVAPEGWRLTGEFVGLSRISAGFFIEPETRQDGGPAFDYVNFVDARRRLEPRTSQEAEPQYAEAAERIAQMGELPFLDGALSVVSASPSQDAVFFCLRRSDGMLFQGATRFVGPLAVTAMRVGDCAEDRTAITAKIDRAEAALAANRSAR